MDGAQNVMLVPQYAVETIVMSKPVPIQQHMRSEHQQISWQEFEELSRG